MKYKTKPKRNKPITFHRGLMIKMMYYMLLDYHRHIEIRESLREIAGYKLVAAQRLVTQKRMEILSKELMPYLRMILGKSHKMFTPSKELLLIVEQAMQRSPHHCLCLVILAAEYGR